MEDAGLDAALRAEIRRTAALEDVSTDIRLALALKLLNTAMPLVCRGEIVTPSWLLDHPEEGYALIAGPVPDLLDRRDSELWLARLKRRAAQVRERAHHLDVALNEEELRINLLSTSRSRLAAIWNERRRVLPDTDHPGLLAILERAVTAEEDLILLLSADVGQCRAADAIIAEAEEAAGRAGVASFEAGIAALWLDRPRRELYAAIEGRLEGFARCGRERIDGWADQFRLERRLPLGRALTLLAIPEAEWRQPPKQSYIATLLDFYAKRITSAAMRGPLTRMIIGKTTPRADLAELASSRRPGSALLDHILLRNEQPIELDPAVLVADPGLERRIRTLYTHATLYRRDTGIDGLYLGFPFLVMREARTVARPRIAPVLLWPVRLRPEVGARGRILVEFDRDREEVRVNPAFGGLLGVDAAARWETAAREMLGRASINADEVMEVFGHLAEIAARQLTDLPSKDIRVHPGEDRLFCSAALFHLAFIGQAVMEDLRQLRAIPPAGSSLETALRVGEPVERGATKRVSYADRYFTAASDPSQEAAVLEARDGRGLLIEGPPGTGKSQTIVNMVADAIGRGKSLLIVCQKQAALDVVHKRLEAEGLGDRIVMVSDVNKDRLRVIRAVREQIESLFARPRGSTLWAQRRTQVAARIEALEADLDAYHETLHAEDGQTGLSYRLVLSDLIGIENEELLPSAPVLRQLLGPLDPGKVILLQETCAPLARLWLQARYEGSALCQLQPFGHDPHTIENFSADLAAFQAAEIARAEINERTPLAIAITDPQPYRVWSDAHAATLKALDDPTRQRLARLLPLFEGTASALPADVLVVGLDRIVAGLETLPADDLGDADVALATGLDDDALAAWTAIADELSVHPTILQRLSISRWLHRRRQRRFMTEQGLADIGAWRGALKREAGLRPYREPLLAIQVALREPMIDLGRCRIGQLLALAHGYLAGIASIRALVEALRAYPEPSAALAMARVATRAALDDLLDGVEQGYARFDARSASRSALDRLRLWLEESWADRVQAAILADMSSVEALRPILEAMPTLAAYQRFRMRVGALHPEALELFAALRSIEPALTALPQGTLDQTVRRLLLRESRLAWKARLERERPTLLFDAAELETKARSLAAADVEMRNLNRRFLVDGLDARQLRPLREWEDITRLRGQRARRLREFLDRGADLGLMTLRPVWLMNPDVASRLLPLRKALFDTVIYAQMPIEYALPTLFRSRSMIVSGDEKQMPPTSFFTSKIEKDEAELYEGDVEDELDEEEREEIDEAWNRREIKDCPDLLQLAKTVLPTTTLQIHYRSTYRELIQFSNASFYASKLSVPARHPHTEIRRVKPLELVRVDGVYEHQTNPAEADRVADILADLWKGSPETRKTVGVVTFNRKQADLIEDVLEERAIDDPSFARALAQERDRVQGGEEMGFFVKNVENVQGDERDIIVFSSTFGRNAQGTFRRSFGVLGQTGGERRLNVAVTRAREKVVLVTSMPIAMISDFLGTRRQATTPRDYLQAYFEYARLMSAGEIDTAHGMLGRLNGDQRGERGYRNDGEIDGFQAAVGDEIARLGWAPSSAADGSAFGLDFAIEDPRTGFYGIGIECDAPRHALLEGARAREIWRPMILTRSISVIHRVSSHGWLHEPEVEKARLRVAINGALGEAV